MMKIESRFPNDDHNLLKAVQLKRYYLSIGNLFYYSRERYITAARLMQVHREEVPKLAFTYSFDDFLLEEAHDIIAAYFRCKVDPHGQMPIPFDGRSYPQFLVDSWEEYFVLQAKKIGEHDVYPRLIAKIVSGGILEEVKKEKDELETMLREDYTLEEELTDESDSFIKDLIIKTYGINNKYFKMK